MIARRKFLKALGLGAAAGPASAKAIADDFLSMSALREGEIAPGGSFACLPPGDKEEYQSPYIKTNDYLSLIGKLPEFVDNELRNRSKYVYSLDPDIISKRSWSWSVKIQEQRKRNYERSVNDCRAMGTLEKAQKLFKAATGFSWPL